MGERHGREGLKIEQLIPAIIVLAVIAKRVKGLEGHEPEHGVRQLDLASCARGLCGEEIENLRLKDVSSCNLEARRRLRGRRLFNHSFHRDERTGWRPKRINDAIGRDPFSRNLVYGDNVAANLPIGRYHLGEA